jgi:hypothetical protein
MQLDLSHILQLYPVLKVLHYQTREGFHHERYDDAVEELGGIADSFIETYLGLHGRDWTVKPMSLRPMLPDTTAACIAMYESVILRDLVPYLYTVAGNEPALRKLAEDFEQEAQKIYGLLNNYSK